MVEGIPLDARHGVVRTEVGPERCERVMKTRRLPSLVREILAFLDYEDTPAGRAVVDPADVFGVAGDDEGAKRLSHFWRQ